MLKEWVKDERPSDEVLAERLEKARAELVWTLDFSNVKL